jgi:hypothetical protein
MIFNADDLDRAYILFDDDPAFVSGLLDLADGPSDNFCQVELYPVERFNLCRLKICQLEHLLYFVRKPLTSVGYSAHNREHVV